MHQRLRRRLFPLPLLLPLLLLLSASLAVGCGGVGSDGAGGLADVASGADTPAPPPDVPSMEPDVPSPADLAQPPEDVGPPPPFAFVPESGDGPGGDVWAEASFERGAAGGDELVVRLQAGGFADLLGFAFDLRYHPGIVTLASVELTDVLSGPTWEGRCAARERGTGRLNVGCSRFLVGQDILSLAQYGGPLEGPASFAIVRFTIEQDGEFDLLVDADRRLARTGDGSVLDVSWRGGRVAIHRDAATEGGQR